MTGDRKGPNNLAILKILRDAAEPLSSAQIEARLQAAGHDLGERSVRLYLQELAGRELVETHGKRGSAITPAGIEELNASQVMQRVGSLAARIDRMTYSMTFDLASTVGAVAINTSLVDREVFGTCLEEICQVFAVGRLTMGDRVALVGPGETIGAITVPPGQVGFCTVCSITVNGVLLKQGIPMRSRFGGILELRGGTPRRFVEYINYDGTSIDPLEVFILSGMTDYRGAITTGDGRIGASFREIPPECRERVQLVEQRLTAIGLGGILAIGQEAEPVLGIPVLEGRAGAVVVGGLNPVSIVVERGNTFRPCALSGLMDYHRLFHYGELPQRFAQL
jgi:hypothetical protein